MSGSLAILAAYAAKRWTLATLHSRAALEARQKKLLAGQLERMARTVPFYRAFASRPLAAWPILDKAAAMQNFATLNAHGVTREQAWAAAEAALAAGNSSGTIGGLTVGTSSGTSGNRGLFLVSDRERALWLGSILARTLPNFPFRRHRVAVMLSTANELYDTTRKSGRLAFSFYDIRQGVLPHLENLCAFAPDTIVAPPKVMRALGEAGAALPLQKIFCGGEVLDPLDAAAIEAAFAVRPRSIYQATEGFLGVACTYGRVHLNEDDMLFEREPVTGSPDRFTPVITDLRRTSQAMIRYRLNDILVLATTPCACGSPLLALERIEGRADDTLKLPAAQGGTVEIMPDAIRTAILDADRRIMDFRVRQVGERVVELAVTGESAVLGVKAVGALRTVFERHGLKRHVAITVVEMPAVDYARKLRRISRDTF